MATELKSLSEEVRAAHSVATEEQRAASDASHPLRAKHSAEYLIRDAHLSFRNMGQTLVPELLRELDEARRLLAQRAAHAPPVSTPQLSPQDLADLRGLRALAREHGWSMSINKPLLTFMRDLIEGLAQLAVKPQGVAEHALTHLAEWWSGNDLRYAEVSQGRKSGVMVTLWQIDRTGDDVKVGHGEGDTLEVAVQRAKGTIVL